MDAEPTYARRALRAGARGYVLKEAADAALVEAVRAVVAGRTYLEPSLGAKLAATDPEPGPARALASEPSALAVGSIFAGHRIDGVVGRGGMGVVFRASDRVLDRTVALKVIMPEVAGDPVFRARFERECRLAAALDHPHIVEVFHAGEEHGLLYLTMRFVDGYDLRRLLDAESRLEPPRAVEIAAQTASALDAAHGLGLIHRDVKPENVLIAQRPGGEHAFLTDFGITKRAADEPLTRTGVAIGTVDYTAPEQARGTDVDARADVYSLGCLLFRMLTGRVLFPRGTELDKLFAHVHEPPPELLDVVPDLPPRLQEVLDRALAKDPRERQQSAGELARSARDALTR
jgi:serine/threonine protein kinase